MTEVAAETPRSRALALVVAAIAIAMSLWHMYIAAFGPPETYFFRGGHLLFFDVDGLKTVNDRDGHFAGDALLQRFGEALRETFEGHATLRYAGDEFVAMLSAEADPDLCIAALRERLEATPAQPAVRFSVGVAAMAPGVELRIALQQADAGMYRDKQGKAGIARAG